MKSVYVDNIENREILLSQVKLDLKSCGIKVSKSKLKLKPEPVVSNGSIFGNWLCFLQCCDVPNCGKVPSFLIDTLEEIEKHILTEGLFRKSGSAARQKELKQIVDDGGSIANAHPLDLAGLLKQFFRELPDSLLPSPLDELFLRCCCLTATADRLHSLLQICLLLPHRHLAVMRYIMQFLWRVTLHCNQNKMDAANLAICLTPNFLHNCLRNFDDKTMTTSGADGKMLKLAIDGMQMLIENADHIGMVEEHLSEHLATVSRSCVCSDDEVNKCEDIGKVRKRKKRSTSLQGLVTNLSSSFSKWRRNSRGHNSSSISNHSTLSSASCAPGEDVTMVLATTDDPDEDMIDLPDVTPKVMRKRKADEEEMIVAFSATKKKAILQKLPQLNSPYTPMNKRNYASEFKDPPNLTFTDNTDLIFSATPSRPRVEQFLAATSAAKRDSLKSNIKTNVSPKASTANANSMRRSVKKFFRRLSSGKETEPPR